LITYALHKQLLIENIENMIQSFVENIYERDFLLENRKLSEIYIWYIELIVNKVKRIE
jgi:hypothetical protein